MNKAQTIFVFLGVLILTSGVAYGAIEYDERYSFEEPISENWNTISNNGTIERTTEYSVHGAYSAELGMGGDSGESRIITKETSLDSSENFTIRFDIRNNGSQSENQYRISDSNENYIYLYELYTGTFDNINFESNIVDGIAFTGTPPAQEEWHTITMQRRGDNFTISNSEETHTGTFTGEFSEPENTNLSIEVYGLSSSSMTTLVDNVRISAHETGLVAVESTDMLFMIAFLFLILFAAVKLRSAVSLICWFFLALASAAILAFDVSFTIYWITVIIAILGVAISGIVYYAQT